MATSSTGDLIEIPPISIAVIRVCIEGTSPLICHHMGEKTRKQLRDTATHVRTKSKVPQDAEQEFTDARYRLAKNGNFLKKNPKGPNKDYPDAIPARYLKDAMVSATRYVKGLAMTQTRTLLFVEQGKEGVPINVRKGKRLLTYGVNVEPDNEESVQRINGKGPGTGSPVLRYRPRYDKWCCAFDVSFNSDWMTAETVFALVNYGGYHAGICEHRPNKSGGQNGTFKVVDKL
jgi:hypothetical protein